MCNNICCRLIYILYFSIYLWSAKLWSQVWWQTPKLVSMCKFILLFCSTKLLGEESEIIDVARQLEYWTHIFSLSINFSELNFTRVSLFVTGGLKGNTTKETRPDRIEWESNGQIRKKATNCDGKSSAARACFHWAIVSTSSFIWWANTRLKDNIYTRSWTHAYHLEGRPGYKDRLRRYTRPSGIHHKATCYVAGSGRKTILSVTNAAT